jgi:hypothetical protein
MKAADHAIHLSPILAEVAQLEKRVVFSRMKTAPEGLSTDEAAGRWADVGPNVVAASRHRNWPWRLLSAMRNPLVILLVVLSAISFATKARMRESMARLTPRFCANRMCRSCSFFSTISIPGFSGGAFCR